MTPSEVGAIAEREVAYALERSGWFVYLPHLAAHARVDLVAVRHAELLRVQVKSARVRDDIVMFRTCSNTGNVPKAYHGEIDAFGVYAPALERVYLVPIQGTPDRVCTLRLEPTKSGQVKGTRLAADFELRPPG